MDYTGLYQDLWTLRQRAMGSDGWCLAEWKQWVQFIDEIDRFLDDLDSRVWI